MLVWLCVVLTTNGRRLPGLLLAVSASQHHHSFSFVVLVYVVVLMCQELKYVLPLLWNEVIGVKLFLPACFVVVQVV
jgi:hypothetical protein